MQGKGGERKEEGRSGPMWDCGTVSTIHSLGRFQRTAAHPPEEHHSCALNQYTHLLTRQMLQKSHEFILDPPSSGRDLNTVTHVCLSVLATSCPVTPASSVVDLGGKGPMLGSKSCRQPPGANASPCRRIMVTAANEGDHANSRELRQPSRQLL